MERGVASARFPCPESVPTPPLLTPLLPAVSPLLFHLGGEPGLPFLEKTTPFHLFIPPGPPQAGLWQRVPSPSRLFSEKLDWAGASPRKRAWVRRPGATFQLLDFNMGSHSSSPLSLTPPSPSPSALGLRDFTVGTRVHTSGIGGLKRGSSPQSPGRELRIFSVREMKSTPAQSAFFHLLAAAGRRPVWHKHQGTPLLHRGSGGMTGARKCAVRN